MYPLSYYKHNGTTTAIFTHVLLSNTPSNVVSKLLDPTAPPPPPPPMLCSVAFSCMVVMPLICFQLGHVHCNRPFAQ